MPRDADTESASALAPPDPMAAAAALLELIDRFDFAGEPWWEPVGAFRPLERGSGERS